MNACTSTESHTFTSSTRSYDRNCSYSNGQLRDLVHCSNERGQVYINYGNRTLRYDCAAQETTCVQYLTFNPTCITYALGYVAAAGAEQELDVKNISRDAQIYKGAVGESVNNAIHIAPNHGSSAAQNGDARLYLSTNDSDVKVFSLPLMEPIHTIRSRVPINYSAQSPDGSYLAAVGDCHSMFLYRITPSGFELDQQYTEAKDSGTSCAWSSMGTFYAGAYQDGVVCAFEPRSPEVVAKYRVAGGRPSRTVKFGHRGVDLMAYSEPQGRVHLVDSRMWKHTQVLQTGGGQICGLSFTPDGSRLYVGTMDQLLAFDIDTLARHTFGCEPTYT